MKLRKKYFALLALVLVFAGGCATSSSRSSLNNKPWDQPMADSHPGYDLPGDAGNEDDMK